MTRFQEAVNALRDLHADALDDLTDTEYEALVDVACCLWGAAAARLFIGRHLRLDARRDEERAA